ncbi:MAG: tape measure protein [Saprospiraceae bacterium]|nr:tape measure protein [Saprospiraceae bacterium]
MAIGDLNVRIGATIKGLQAGLKSAERELKTFARQTNNLGNSLTLGLSVPLAGIGAAAVQAFAQFEGLKNGLTAIAGSAQEAEAQLTRLRKIALQPSINLEQAVKSSIQLQSVGFEAEEAERAISQFAKAATLSNAGADGLEEVVRQITQINSKGAILASDLRVITDRIPVVGLALQDAFGTNNVELIRESGISAREFTDRLIDAIEASKVFQAAQGGLATQIENFGIGLKESGVALGEAIAKSINLGATLEKLTGFVNKVVEGFKALKPEQQKAIVQIGLLVVAVGPAVKVISLLATAVLALTSPLNIAIGIIVALAAGFIYAYNTSESFRGGLFAIAEAAKVVFSAVSASAKAFVEGFQALGQGEFKKAAASFGEALIIANPINFAATYGADLAAALAAGFTKGVGAKKLSVDDLLDQATGKSKGGPTLDLSGAGGKKKKQKLDQDFFDVSAEIPVIPTLDLRGVGDIRITEEFKKAFAQIPADVLNADNSLKGLADRLTNAVLPALKETITAIPSSSKAFQDLALQFENIDRTAALFGDTANALPEKLSLVNNLKGVGAIIAGVALIAVATAARAGLNKQAERFAAGGIVTAPTYGLVGEAGPEAIIPLRKLGDVTGMGNMELVTRVSGDDLYLIMQRATTRKNRIG